MSENTTAVVGVDPGKKGYQCQLTGELTMFRPSFVSSEGEYQIPLMVSMCQGWREDGVRLVVLEQQAPRAHGQQKEGTLSSWINGYGFGVWEAALVAAGFKEATEDSLDAEPSYIKVEPQVWKRRMGAMSVGHAGMTHAQRRKGADAASIETAQRLGPGIDFRALERTPGARVASADKSCSFLMCKYALWLLDRRPAPQPQVVGAESVAERAARARAEIQEGRTE